MNKEVGKQSVKYGVQLTEAGEQFWMEEPGRPGMRVWLQQVRLVARQVVRKKGKKIWNNIQSYAGGWAMGNETSECKSIP